MALTDWEGEKLIGPYLGTSDRACEGQERLVPAKDGFVMVLPPPLTAGTKMERNRTESLRLTESGFVHGYRWWAPAPIPHKQAGNTPLNVARRLPGVRNAFKLLAIGLIPGGIGQS